jgi:hypothetical protein
LGWFQPPSSVTGKLQSDPTIVMALCCLPNPGWEGWAHFIPACISTTMWAGGIVVTYLQKGFWPSVGPIFHARAMFNNFSFSEANINQWFERLIKMRNFGSVHNTRLQSSKLPTRSGWY